MYEKQAILEYILHQKKEIAKKMKVSSNMSDYITLTILEWGWPTADELERIEIVIEPFLDWKG